MSEEEQKWKRRLERERASRKEAEKLLESKSAELFELNKTLKYKIEEELEKNRNKELILLQQSKMASLGEMIGNIAHQWRQPLSAISSIASSLQLYNELDTITREESNKMLADIVEHTQFLSNTIEDFRNFFKSDKEHEKFFIDKSIEKCIKIVSGVLHNKSISLITQIEHLEIDSLQNEFIQVILNLIKNAIDAMDNIENEDEKFILIRTWEDKALNEIAIEVSDSAKGIPETILNKIFEPYFTTKHQSQGTGIGLFMSLEIIQKHMKGKMSVINKMTQFTPHKELYGASFTIRIPKNY